jgi:hypothetical protein
VGVIMGPSQLFTPPMVHIVNYAARASAFSAQVLSVGLTRLARASGRVVIC